ncbi:hypothetical protein [Paraburkholderia sp.]|uniref:hypothetical protein n=1 Tax=Paraburkholderia sp. TaxID=1926495 RepID=UPI003C7C3124
MEDLILIDELLGAMWEQHVIHPTYLIVAPQHERMLMRWKFPKLPHARTANMRRLRKLKYRRHP